MQKFALIVQDEATGHLFVHHTREAEVFTDADGRQWPGQTLQDYWPDPNLPIDQWQPRGAPRLVSDAHPGEDWRPVADDVGPNWTLGQDGKFSAPVPHPPAPKTVFSARDFIQKLFTSGEQQAIFTAAQTNWQISRFITLVSSGPVDITTDEVKADVAAVQAAGLITSDRAAQILAGTAAPQS